MDPVQLLEEPTEEWTRVRCLASPSRAEVYVPTRFIESEPAARERFEWEQAHPLSSRECQPLPAKLTATMLYPYTTQNSNVFVKDEIVTFIKDLENGWALVQKENSTQDYVPQTYIQKHF